MDHIGSITLTMAMASQSQTDGYNPSGVPSEGIRIPGKYVSCQETGKMRLWSEIVASPCSLPKSVNKIASRRERKNIGASQWCINEVSLHLQLGSGKYDT